MSDGNGVVYEFQKNALERVRVALTEYRGHDLIDLRVYYTDDGETYKPSRKGVAFNASLLPDLEEAVKRLREVAQKEGLLDDGDEE